VKNSDRSSRRGPTLRGRQTQQNRFEARRKRDEWKKQGGEGGVVLRESERRLGGGSLASTATRYFTSGKVGMTFSFILGWALFRRGGIRKKVVKI